MAKRAVVLAAVTLVACGGESSSQPAVTADDLAQMEIAGETITRIITDDAEATDFVSPDPVKLGVVDAAHVIGAPVTFTVYQYTDAGGAEAAMAAWRADIEDGVFGDIPFQSPATNVGAASGLANDSDDSLVIVMRDANHVVARKGPFIVRAIGDEASSVEAIKALFGGI